MRRNDFLEFRDRIRSLDFSAGCRNKITGTVKTILREALFRELINRDITTGVGQLGENDKKTKYVPTIEEVRQIIHPGNHHYSETDRIALIIMASTGIRRSELIALRCVRIKDGAVLIDQTYKASGVAGNKGLMDYRNGTLPRGFPYRLSWKKHSASGQDLETTQSAIQMADLIHAKG